jgi:hypothetical protein
MISANERPRWAPWDRPATLACVALVGIALASLVWLVHPWYEAGNETNDASIYIACAKSMIAGEGYAYLGEPFTARPPGFAAMIAPVIAWRGLDFHALNLLVSVTGVALVTLLFVFARARVGTWVALSISLAVWFNDGFRTLCCQVMSDVPGAALLFLYLLVERWAARKPSWRRNALLGLVVGISAYLRSILILLGPATLLSRVCDKVSTGERGGWLRFVATRVAPLAATLFLVQLPWNVRNALHAPQHPVDQNFLYSYSTAMWHVDGGDPASPRRSLSEIVGRVPGRTIQVLDALGRRMGAHTNPEADEPGQPVETAIGAALLAAILFIAWRRREPAEIFALAATAVLCIYFGFRDRLVLPIFILALVAAAECALLLARRVPHARAEIAVAVLLLALPVLDFRPRASWDRIETAHTVTTELCTALASRLVPGERVAAPVGWHYSVYLDRPVWSLFFGARREGSMQGVEDVIEKRSIDAVVLSPLFPADRAMLPWFREHHGPGEAAGAGFVFRLKR